MCNARFSCRSPPRGSRCRARSALATSTGRPRRSWQTPRSWKPAGPAGAAEQPGRDDRADAVDLGEPAAVLGERLRHLGGQLGEAGVDLAHLGDQVPGDLLAGGLDGSDGSHRGEDPGGAGGDQVSVGATRDEIAQQRVQLVDQPGPVRGQVGAPLVEQRQHRGQVLDQDRRGVAGQRGHARGGGGVDDV
jgi:hypothetical protein